MRKAGIPFLLLLALAVAALAMQAHDEKKGQPLSPPGTADYTFADGKKVTIKYGRPSMRGRKIMGELVPYGKVWRTGANSATSLTTDTNLVIGGTNVPAGSYTLYTLPDANDWKLIINKQTGQWGTEYDQSKDLARVGLKKESLSSPAEQFTIAFDKTGGNSANLVLTWENTKLTTDVKEAK